MIARLRARWEAEAEPYRVSGGRWLACSRREHVRTADSVGSDEDIRRARGSYVWDENDRGYRCEVVGGWPNWDLCLSTPETPSRGGEVRVSVGVRSPYCTKYAPLRT